MILPGFALSEKSADKSGIKPAFIPQSPALCYRIAMIRTFAIALALSVSFPAFMGPAAYAQAPDTDQTDRSEDDWRKSKKKESGEDTLKDIFQNKTIFGQGSGGYEQNPIDALPERSRNHLKKERAKALATVDPNNVPDIPYVPSREAQSDPELAEQEKEVWEGMVKDMQNGGAAKVQRAKEIRSRPGKSTGDEGGSGQSGANPAGNGSSSGESDSRSTSKPTPVRGGSSSSVSDILSKIKGIKSGNGTSPAGIPAGTTGASGAGQAPSGSGQNGQSQTPGQNAGAAGNGAAQSQGDSRSNSTSNAGDQSAASAGDAAQAGQANGDQASQAGQQSNAPQIPPGTLSNPPGQPSAEILGPLERMKQQREQNNSGRQSSAYDFLKDAQKAD